MKLGRRGFIEGALAGLCLMQFRQAAFAKEEFKLGLKDLFKGDFKVGTAVAGSTFTKRDTELQMLIAREFNAITAENAMKWQPINPKEGQWKWDVADQFVDFGQRNGMYIVGHNLVWHSQTPEWVFRDKGQVVSPLILRKRMADHIATLVGRYKGRIAAWDVVNEAIEDKGQWRESDWYKVLGQGYLAEAFHLAHAADPKAHLMYNDYNMFLPAKRDAVVAMLRQFKRDGVPIHGVGMQGHLGIDTPDLAEVEKSIEAFAREGVRVHVTELDVDVLPSVWAVNGAEISSRFEYKPELDPYAKGLPAAMEEKLSRRYEAIFKLFLKHRDKIERVTTWGVCDDTSWLNGFPVEGRTNYPLLFDRAHKPKLAYQRVAALKI